VTDVPRVRLGRSPIEVAPLGVGTWAWGDRAIWGFGGDYGEPEVAEAFEASRSAGLDLFDSAEIYGWGRSERILGRLARGSPGSLIASKFFPFPWRWSREALPRAVRASLRRLGVPVIDLYQIHWPSILVPNRVWLESMADAVDEGLVRAVGVSNFSATQMEQAADVLARRGIPLASNQVEFSLIERDPERSGLLERCRQMGVTLIAYSPLGMGLLTGKYGPDHPPPLARHGRAALTLRRIQPLLEAVRETGAGCGRTMAQVALNWTLSKGTLPIPGAKNRRQAEENAGALGWSLTPEEVRRLDEVSERAFGGRRRVA
jgi:aryl-alcohol dehydrogenase-like predicted oxidoreductase